MKKNLRIYTKRNLKRNILEIFLQSLSITHWIVLINVIFFITVMIFVIIYGESAFKYVALKPSDIMQGNYLWTFITSMFMHGGIFHLFINMFVLLSLGNFCEKIIGRKRFLWFYLISGIVAGLLFVLLSGIFGATELGAKIFGSPLMPAVGASGAIFAIAGLFMVLIPKLKFSIIFRKVEQKSREFLIRLEFLF